MFTEAQIQHARACCERVTGISLPRSVRVIYGEGLTVKNAGPDSVIQASDINSLTRGFFILSRAAKEGWAPGVTAQHRHFSSCGAMVDVSRNAVMKVETVKHAIDQLACLGMNLLMLYTEDTFEVPEYPALGYLRGGYSAQEIRDDYAASLGVELVPCIQTLAHLSQFLQWNVSAQLADTYDVLMIDEPETYAFIEAEIRAISSCVRSKRIHIGMDEAHGVGLGQYYAKHGPTDRFQLLRRHLDRVVSICQKYGLEPMMWSDMFFRLGSKTNSYYDLEADIPQDILDTLPPVDMVFWDYYHTDPALYDRMLAEHARMGKETFFAGGVWTWSGFLPQVKRTEASMSVALKVCAAHHVDTVFATMWGDDGAETNTLLASSLLPIFSEACWQGAECPKTEIVKAGECLTGLPYEALCAWGDFYPDETDSRPGKQLIWGDPLFPLTVLSKNDSLGAVIARSEHAMQVLAPYQDRLDCRYASALFDVCVKKAALIDQVRARYLAGDKAWLQRAAEQDIPALHAAYRRLCDLHRALWERDNRRFGWEVLALRYGGAMERLRDVQDEIQRYLAGELSCIEELDAEPLGLIKGYGHHIYGKFVTPAMDYWQRL